MLNICEILCRDFETLGILFELLSDVFDSLAARPVFQSGNTEHVKHLRKLFT